MEFQELKTEFPGIPLSHDLKVVAIYKIIFLKYSISLLILFFTLPSVCFAQIDTLQLISSFGLFQNAVSVSASRGEFIFIADAQSNMIYKFSAGGKLLTSFGGAGFGSDQLSNPLGIDATNGLDVFVCDYQNNRIQRYDMNLAYVATFDFSAYNQTADNSQKIFYPRSLAFLSTGEICAAVDATTYKIVKLKSFNEVSISFGTNTIGFENLSYPIKIVKGSSLDIWVQDKGTNDLLNYDNYGTYIRRIISLDKNNLISIAYYSDILYILNEKELLSYDLKSNKYTAFNYFLLPVNDKVTDLAMLDKNTALILSKSKIFIYKLN